MSTTKSRYFVKAGEAEAYHPANHLGTVNRRIIGTETVGAKQLEVLHGTIEKGKGALPHAHPGIEQVCYMLEGCASAEANGDEPVKLLVIHSPPYEENHVRVIRPTGNS